MIVSVKVGFLYKDIFQVVGVLWMLTSKMFILLLVSVSGVNFRLRCTVLKSSNIVWMLVWLESKINRLPST